MLQPVQHLYNLEAAEAPPPLLHYALGRVTRGNGPVEWGLNLKFGLTALQGPGPGGLTWPMFTLCHLLRVHP